MARSCLPFALIRVDKEGMRKFTIWERALGFALKRVFSLRTFCGTAPSRGCSGWTLLWPVVPARGLACAAERVTRHDWNDENIRIFWKIEKKSRARRKTRAHRALEIWSEKITKNARKKGKGRRETKKRNCSFGKYYHLIYSYFIFRNLHSLAAQFSFPKVKKCSKCLFEENSQRLIVYLRTYRISTL